MNAPARQQAIWRLVFVAGPQRGRTVNLQHGENWIGSAPDCAIVVASEDVDARQILLTVGDIAASVRNTGNNGNAEAMLNGVPLDQQRRSIGPGDIVTLGRTKFEIERVMPEEIDSTPVADERAADYAWQKALNPQPAASATPAAPAARSPKTLWHRLRHSWSAWAVLAGLCVVSVGVFPNAMDSDKPEGENDVTAKRVAALQTTLAKYPDVVVRDEKAGRLTVAGYVISAEERRRVQDLVRQSALQASVDVHVASDVLHRTRQFFSGTSLAIDYDEARNIVISGTVEQAVLAQRIKNFIADMRGTVAIIDKVQYNIARTDSAPGRTFTPRVPLPTVVGVFIERPGGTRWIQTADGGRYTEGNQIKGGLQVVRITLDQVDFLRDGERLTWRVGQKDIQ